MSQGHLRAGDCPPPFLAKIHRTQKHCISTFLLGQMFSNIFKYKGIFRDQVAVWEDLEPCHWRLLLPWDWFATVFMAWNFWNVPIFTTVTWCNSIGHPLDCGQIWKDEDLSSEIPKFLGRSPVEKLSKFGQVRGEILNTTFLRLGRRMDAESADPLISESGNFEVYFYLVGYFEHDIARFAAIPQLLLQETQRCI